MAVPVGLTDAAETLLLKLQAGDNIAEPTNYPGSLCFNDHAIAYLNNAVSICKSNDAIDFRVFAAFYAIRHGMELWLKCTIQNQLIDEILEAIGDSSTDLNCIIKEFQLGKEQTKGFVSALCAMHNVMVNNIVYPECWEADITDAHANRAIEFMRDNRKTPRSRFLWIPQVHGHELFGLWDKAKPRIADVHHRAIEQANWTGLGHPSAVEDLEVVCQLLGGLDETGDVFRYPMSFHGEWYLRLPHVSMDRLAELAQALEDTVRAHDSLLEEAYSLSSFGCPWMF